MTQIKNSNHSNVDAALRALEQLNKALSDTPKSETLDVFVENSPQTIELPREIATVLQEILTNSVAGNSIGIIPMNAELTTQQAANSLNVSRPHVVKLMDQGLLKGHKVGTHRRLYASDVEAYKQKRDAEAKAATDELTALSEEMGLYE